MLLGVLRVCSFLLLSTLLLCENGTIVFIRSPVNEHLGSFQFGALRNKVTKNVFKKRKRGGNWDHH